MSHLAAKKGQWVLIQRTILDPTERAPQVPQDTLNTPFLMRVKGFLLDEEADIGSSARIITSVGRVITGSLVAVNPRYDHDFGDYVPELSEAGQELTELMAKLKERDDL